MNFDDIDFHSPFDKVKKKAKTPQEALFQAIIIQAMVDATSNAKKLKNKALEAKKWLYSNEEDLQQIATLAGTDAKEINKKSRKFLQKNCSWRTTSCKNKHNDKRRAKEGETKKYQKAKDLY